ncbi:MAG: hypothetical protein NTX71_12190 [Candidatus Aureabacteria bacterium]|nr:hypothetical protein [Candidatus Auribacterota bacterium]
MRVPPHTRRFPIEMSAVLCLVLPALVLGSGTARGGPGAGGTSLGTILSIDRERRILKVENESGSIDTFHIDDAATLIFCGARPLRIGELRAGMKIETDCRPSGRAHPPTVTWIEVREDKDK